MKFWLLLFMCLLVSACQSSPLPAEESQKIAKDSTLPMTRFEAQNAACDSDGGDNQEKCSCISSELYELGKADNFGVYILNEAKCGTSENPRQTVIGLLKKDAYGICHNIAPPLLSLQCWDGALIEYRNPCFSCPPAPYPN